MIDALLKAHADPNVRLKRSLWYTTYNRDNLRVDFKGDCFSVHYDDEQLFEVRDSTFGDAGMVGLWTKADSVTSFDDFSFGSAAKP